MKKELIYSLLALILCVLVLIGDILIVYGYVEWLLYIVPLLVIYKAGQPGLSFLLLGIIGIFLGIGFWVSPDPAISPLVSLTDRLEGFVVFTAYTIVINALIRSRRVCNEARVLAEKKSEEIAAVNNELEAFSYSVSHDLRNPLYVIASFTQLLQEDCGERLGEKGHEYLGFIDNGTKRMQQLIDDMLSLSKVSRQEVNREEFDLGTMASSILIELAQTSPQRSVSWHVQSNLRVHADAGLMQIALSNLLGNAWKYTGKTEKASIEVGAWKQDGQTVYYVRDTGVGFDMELAASIFTPFHRLHSEHEFSGTGVGLAIVQRIIQRHHGQIWAESQIGKGATFYFTLH